MENMISCCGVNCSKCEYYPDSCKGCDVIRGKAFWLEYTGEDICSIYQCCIVDKKRKHCGLCTNFPCQHYEQDDPTKTREENEAIFEKQKENLKRMG